MTKEIGGYRQSFSDKKVQTFSFFSLEQCLKGFHGFHTGKDLPPVLVFMGDTQCKKKKNSGKIGKPDEVSSEYPVKV